MTLLFETIGGYPIQFFVNNFCINRFTNFILLRSENHKFHSPIHWCRLFIDKKVPDWVITCLDILKRDNFRFSAKVIQEDGSAFSGNISTILLLSSSSSLNNNMAGLYSKPTSSRSGSRRESFEGTHREELFAFDKEFIQLLRQLPDYLMRLQSESNRLQKEAKASPSR